MLSKYAKTREVPFYRNFGMKNLMVEEAVQEIAPTSPDLANSMADGEISSSSTDFSQTNIQKS